VITTVCTGWPDAEGKRVHTEPRVLVQGDEDGPWSNGICIPCRDAYLERINQQWAERQAARKGEGT